MMESKAIITDAQARQDFSRVVQIAAERGRVYVLQNDRPKLLVIDLDVEPQIELSEEEKFQLVTQRILREHRAAFEELAK
ncbi:MAG: hypothetical protein IKH03_04650 [Oscillospiraceae bacterium]|nr:hypothetical protein [Oscillospiraceae bacterium]